MSYGDDDDDDDNDDQPPSYDHAATSVNRPSPSIIIISYGDMAKGKEG